MQKPKIMSSNVFVHNLKTVCLPSTREEKKPERNPI